jgi:predicted nucleic acid-binding Zn ribbon protein
MPDDQIPVTVSLNCKKCGNPGVTLPDGPSDNALITCPACGAELGTRTQFEATLREGAGNFAADLFKETLSKAFGDSPNVKLKL